MPSLMEELEIKGKEKILHVEGFFLGNKRILKKTFHHCFLFSFFPKFPLISFHVSTPKLDPKTTYLCSCYFIPL